MPDPTTPNPGQRPWGNYKVLDNGDGFQVKRITVEPGKRLSYQRHAQRSEHWYVVAGSGRVTLDGEHLEVETGDAIDVPIGQLHRIECTSPGPLVFIEAQMGSYLGEDDIERVDDDYGRS